MVTMMGPGREDSTKLSTIAREYRGRDLDLACLAAVALVSLSLWPRGPGRQVSKSNAWQMGEGVGECLDGCAIAIKEEGPIRARARRVCWMGMVDLEACTRITLPSHSLPALYTTSTSNKLNC
jgi:hypothetical protein